MMLKCGWPVRAIAGEVSYARHLQSLIDAFMKLAVSGTSRIVWCHRRRVPPMPTMHSSCIMPSLDGHSLSNAESVSNAPGFRNFLSDEINHPVECYVGKA
jgi:hypothetical protein